jgi:hypothetical protein
MVLAKRHRFHVNLGVLPDLGIDEAREETRKDAFGKTRHCKPPVLVDGFSEMPVAGSTNP